MEDEPVGCNFERGVWFSGFRGKDLNVKAYDERQVMTKAKNDMP
jgi:hypothetical protein